jgi:protein-tyrosine phosphatase
MSGYVDLHCHWLPGIDDGPTSLDESHEMLRALAAAGFELVVATPHMRPGLFDNLRSDLEAAFARVEAQLRGDAELPRVALSSEHYLDDVVFQRLLDGSGLPYPGGQAVLVELYGMNQPVALEHRFADLRRRGLLPVIAHPERYGYVWKDPDALERFVDTGAAALLNAAALDGKYGRQVRKTAEQLLEAGLYHAACSDAHCVADVGELERGLARIRKRYGEEEVDFLFREGPTAILAGQVPT